MYAKLSAVAALVVAAVFVVTGMASAGGAATHQRIEIVSQSDGATFTLTPLTSGPIKADSGTATACCWTRRFIRRDGESIEIDNPLRTFQGKQGSFAWRARIAWVDLGSGYAVATGSWKIVHGTGAYAHLQGHGRVALIGDPNDQAPGRAEGLVDLRR